MPDELRENSDFWYKIGQLKGTAFPYGFLGPITRQRLISEVTTLLENAGVENPETVLAELTRYR